MFPVLGFRSPACCDPEPDNGPLWALVSQCLERELDEITLRPPLVLAMLSYIVIS